MANLKEKINQLFILGYEGNDFRKNGNFVNLLENELGGVIFFSKNILEEEQFKNQIDLIKSFSNIPPFLSIDEEGGRVERFENINRDYPNGKKYLSARYIAQKGENALKNQTQKIVDDLKFFGLNMNFSPVLDVDSNSENPIIGERAYSNNPYEAVKYALIVNEVFNKNKIITVGKHFPGHGDTKTDSHIELPFVNLSFKELEKTHIYPFKKAIEAGIPAIMVAHVYYSCFDKEKIPASVSKNVLNYLCQNLNYKGLIISDDMEMGAITSYNKLNTVVKMINNGVNCFIYRTCNDEIYNLLNEIEERAKNDKTLQIAIEKSYYKILTLKKRFLI